MTNAEAAKVLREAADEKCTGMSDIGEPQECWTFEEPLRAAMLAGAEALERGACAEYDAVADVLTFGGVKYSGAFLRMFSKEGCESMAGTQFSIGWGPCGAVVTKHQPLPAGPEGIMEGVARKNGKTNTRAQPEYLETFGEQIKDTV